MLKEYLSNIANALRQTLGINDKINAQDFANKVGEVYEKGQQAEYDKFWDTLQINGKRGQYYGTFIAFPTDLFYPKYDLVVITSAYQMFRAFGGIVAQNEADNIAYPALNLTERLQECGVRLDTSRATDLTGMATLARFNRFPEIDARNASNLNQIFSSNYYIQTIDKIILKDDGSQTFSNSFSNNGQLKNITFEGVIGKNIDFSYSPLTVESMLSIIEHLKDYSNNGGTYTVTFKADRETMLTDEQKALATNKGWSVVWN